MPPRYPAPYAPPTGLVWDGFDEAGFLAAMQPLQSNADEIPSAPIPPEVAAADQVADSLRGADDGFSYGVHNQFAEGLQRGVLPAKTPFSVESGTEYAQLDPGPDGTELAPKPATLQDLNIAGVDPTKARLAASLAGPTAGRAFIGQSAGPVGTIGQIGRDPLAAQEESPLELPWGGEAKSAESGQAQPPVIDSLPSMQNPDALPLSEQPLTGEELTKKLLALPEEQRIEELGKIVDRHRKFKLEGQERILAGHREREAADQREREAANARAQAKRDAINADAQALRDDPLRNMSMFSKVAGVLAAFVGGFNKADPGMGLRAVEGMIEREINLQKGNIADRRGSLADEVAQNATTFHDREVKRMAMLDEAIQQLGMELQKFDPQGQKVRELMPQYEALIAARQKADMANHNALVKAEQERVDYQIKVREDNRKQQKHELDMAKARGQLGAGTAKPVKFEDAPQSADQLRSLGIAIPDGAKLPPEGLSLNQARKLSETAKSAEDWNKARRENSPEERGRQFEVPGVVDDQGNSVPLRNPEKVAKVMAAGDTTVQLLDRLISARAKYGWSSDLLKSPEWREMKSDYASLLLEKKNFDELGVIAGADMTLMGDALGTTDPTEARDPTPGLQRIRKSTIDKVNTIRYYEAKPAQGRKVVRWDPPPPPAEAARPPAQESVQSLLTFDPKRVKRGEGSGTDALAEGDSYLPETHRRQIDRLVEAFHSAATDEERKQAGADLENVKNNARSAAIRDYAVKAATAGAMSSIPMSAEQVQ